MARTESLNKALTNLLACSPDIEACAVVSADGLVIASSLPKGIEESTVAAMSAVLVSLGRRTAQELSRGALEQVFIKGDAGYVVLTQTGPEAVLIAMARRDSKLGLIFLDLSRAAEDIKQILG